MNIISSLFNIAYFLPIALPPTVIEDITELIISEENKIGIGVTLVMCNASIAPTEPLTIPQISPITSLHILAILLEFFIKDTLSLEPFIFLELLAWKEDSSAVNTAVPIISKKIPIKTKAIASTIKAM